MKTAYSNDIEWIKYGFKNTSLSSLFTKKLIAPKLQSKNIKNVHAKKKKKLSIKLR